MKKIGFIGTGVMGKGMIRNLMKNGFELYVYNRTKEKALPFLRRGPSGAIPRRCAPPGATL